MERFIETISETLGRYVPSVFGAIIILVLGLLLAKLVHAGLTNLLGRTRLDEKLGTRTNGNLKLSALISTTVFYLLVLYVALIALGVLGIEGVLDPAKAMLTRFLHFVPNGIAAGLIGLVGYIIARIVSEGVRLAASSLDGFAPKLGLGDKARPSQIIGTVLFVIILVPVLIAALDALKVQAISGPAIAMLERLLAILPNLIAAVLILAVAYLVGRFVLGLLINLLQGADADNVVQRLGAGRVFGSVGVPAAVGNIVLLFIMLGAALTAVDALQLDRLAGVLETLLTFAGNVAVGLIIIALGVWLAGLVHDRLHQDGRPSPLAGIARIAILGFVLALGLRAMGIGEDIVNLAFGLTLGAAAVAFALAFGLGGREAAGKQLEQWLARWRNQG
jgi:hypothetical protein